MVIGYSITIKQNEVIDLKKLLASVFITLTTIALFSSAALAAPNTANEETAPFTGTFTGTVIGDNDTETTLTLDLTDQDNTITGITSLGKGLLVDAGGLCGSTILPAASIWAEGETSAKHPDQLTAEAQIDVGPFVVTVEVTGELSADGETLAVEAEIDTPWMCGRDPVITGTLTKVS